MHFATPQLGVIMTNSKFKSLRDMGYQQAAVGDTLSALAQYAIDHIAGFPTEVPSEAKSELYEGYQLRFNENNPAKIYAVINDHYILATEEHLKNKKIEKIEVGVAYAYSYSSQEFGKLKNTNPALHSLIGRVREKAVTYCSNRLGDLKSAAVRLLRTDSKTQRTTLDFVQSMTNAFDAQEKSVKIKQGRGDTTANADKYKKAVAAFWVSYK
jgi:hypothetical protein